MTATPDSLPDSHALLTKAEQLLEELQQQQGEVVGSKQLQREIAARKNQLYVAVAAMSLITILSVLLTVALLRQPGPAGPMGPTPISAQFVQDDGTCYYRVLYRSNTGVISTVSAAANPGACP